MMLDDEVTLMSFWVEDSGGNRDLLCVTRRTDYPNGISQPEIVYRVTLGRAIEEVRLTHVPFSIRDRWAKDWAARTIGEMMQAHWEKTSFERNSKRMMQARIMQKPSP